ncbi:type IVB secretion system protein IcmH/DotU [Roseateles sp. BYS87W]|uniref:Type IVB secretion system protein IcmH/DotU n=1 Tax=Pelomonas baiyunensis TaxID=3299026 RepID=A0ABW7H519_9BURK
MNATAPSLFGAAAAPSNAVRLAGSPRQARDLMDLLYDGFYMIFLLRNRHHPADAASFRERIRDFLIQFERGAHKLGTPAEDVFAAKFAFVALIDELALSPQLHLRDAWELRPLQIELFGEQLAGEKFFDHLEQLRAQGAARLQALEVFHMCLLLGFTGKYVLEGSEKLQYLTARLGDEIAQLRGRGRGGLAPHALPPDRILHTLKHELPLWVMGSVFALLALVAYIGLAQWLTHQTESDLQAHQALVQMPAESAHVTITLP